MVTSFDYIIKAGQQLDCFCNWFKSPQSRTDLANRTGLDINENTELLTGIVMANRMFMGYRINNHPIRGLYELVNYVENGTVRIGEEKHCFWEGGIFCASEMKRYLAQDATYTDRWDNMLPFDETYCINEHTVYVERLCLDLKKHAESLGRVP